MGVRRDALLPITEHDHRKVRVPGVLLRAMFSPRNREGFSDAAFRQIHPRKVEVMLLKIYFHFFVSQSILLESRRELMQMLHTRKKAEIEVLSSLPFSKNAADESTEFMRKRQKTSSFTPLVEYVKTSIHRVLSECG